MNFAEAAYHFFYLRRKRDAESRIAHFENARIVSVGNLTTGGTGKTPGVQWLARRFQTENISCAIVGRGYGGEYSRPGAIVCDGGEILLNARQAGDEAILHARALENVPVVIGRDRVAAAKIAIEKFAPQVVILDDGFQFWSLARDFDLVLLDARRPFGNGKLLPSGRLREPKKELRRASGVLLTRGDAATESEIARAKKEIRELCDAPIFISSHVAKGLRDEMTGEPLPSGVLQAQRVGAMSALANNAHFFDSLRGMKADVGSTLARRDHHFWREKEVRNFAHEAKRNGAAAIITTEKDAVKIDADWCEGIALWSLQIELQFAESEMEEGLWRLIERSVSS